MRWDQAMLRAIDEQIHRIKNVSPDIKLVEAPIVETATMTIRQLLVRAGELATDTHKCPHCGSGG